MPRFPSPHSQAESRRVPFFVLLEFGRVSHRLLREGEAACRWWQPAADKECAADKSGAEKSVSLFRNHFSLACSNKSIFIARAASTDR